MKVVIVGGGNVGTFIAAELTRGGHEVTIIEIEADRVARAQATGEPAGVRWVLADACEVDDLRKVPLDGVDVLAAVTGDDEDNLVVSLLAKQEFAVPRVDRPREQPEEPLDVRRELGRRRRGVHAAPARPRSSRRPCRSARSCGCSASSAAAPA